MPELVNTTNGVFHYKNEFHFLPGEPVEVPEEDAQYLLETYPGRFQVNAQDRALRGGRNRSGDGDSGDC